jgi:hypothetical protein
MIAVLHAQYGMGYLWAIKDISTTEEFEEITGKNYLDFEKAALAVQDSVTVHAVNECPAFAGKDINQYLADIAGEI